MIVAVDGTLDTCTFEEPPTIDDIHATIWRSTGHYIIVQTDVLDYCVYATDALIRHSGPQGEVLKRLGGSAFRSPSLEAAIMWAVLHV